MKATKSESLLTKPNIMFAVVPVENTNTKIRQMPIGYISFEKLAASDIVSVLAYS